MPDCADCAMAQAIAAKLDEIVNRWHHPLEGQWNSMEWQDITLVGNEAAGAVLAQRNAIGFRARSVIVYNTSNARLFLNPGAVMIPPGCTEFVARVKPPSDTFKLVVNAAPTVGGEVEIYLTEELLRPSVAAL